jgi:hypothetical protein
MTFSNPARILACLAAIGGLSLAFGQGAASAQADAAAEMRALQARVDQLSARVAALDALVVRQGAVTTIAGGRTNDELVLRANADPARGLSLVKQDVTLRFARITLVGDEISLRAVRGISLKGATIDLDGAINAKGSQNVPIKGSQIRDDGPGSGNIRVGGGRVGDN